eukprot:jgi/Botrbrau1/21192/Bobra.0431s0001.1
MQKPLVVRPHARMDCPRMHTLTLHINVPRPCGGTLVLISINPLLHLKDLGGHGGGGGPGVGKRGTRWVGMGVGEACACRLEYGTQAYGAGLSQFMLSVPVPPGRHQGGPTPL